MFDLIRGRRWPWLLLASVGAALAALPWLISTSARYFGADLATRDQLSSVYSFWVGFISLAIASFGLLKQAKAPHPPGLGTPATQPAPGMTSLAVPDLVSVSPVLGRDSLIADLTGIYGWRASRSSSTARVHVLHGMGGAGKTVVAMLTARQLSQHGVTTWWVSAGTRIDLHTGMRQLATQLGASPWELEREWADNAPEVLWRRLDAYRGPWLLIVDNADEPNMLAPAGEAIAAKRGWIRPPRGNRGAIIVTSRNGESETWGPWCRRHAVGMLSDADGAQLLLSHVGVRAGTIDDATMLAARLGGLPLALTMTARFLANQARLPLTGSIETFAECRQTLDVEGIGRLLGSPRYTFSSADGRKAVDLTWELSLDALERRGLPQARTLLRLLAIMADSPIPYRLLLDARAIASSPLFPELDPQRLTTLLQALAGLGLLDLHSSGSPSSGGGAYLPTESLRLHPLIRDASRHHLQRSSQLGDTLNLAAHLLDNAISSDLLNKAEDPAEWPAWRMFAPHAFYLAALIGQGRNLDKRAAENALTAAQRATRFIGSQRLYRDAVSELRQLLDVSRLLLGEMHTVTLLLRTDLAWWRGHAESPEVALEQLREILPLREVASGKEHEHTLTVRADIAEWTGQANARDAARARDLYAEILPIRERVSGVEHSDTLLVRSRLANWTARAGNAALARRMLLELGPIRERVSGLEHVDTLLLRRNSAEWAAEAGNVAEAREEFRALVATCRRVLGDDHLDTLEVRVRLARWTGLAGDWISAHNQLIQVIDPYLSGCGIGSPKATEAKELFLLSARLSGTK